LQTIRGDLKMRNKLLLGLMTATMALPGLINTAYADDNYDDRARVISVTPQLQRVNNPRQECRTEYVRESYYENRERSNTGAIVGGLTGGLVGSRFGGGKGRIATAVLGAGLGAIVGDRYDNNDLNGRGRGRERTESRPVERCVSVDNWQNVPAGYLVNYEYNGRQYSTVTDQDPGRFIPVSVQIRPNGRVSQVSYNDNNDDSQDWNRGEHRGWNKHRDNDRDGREHGYW
jgi:uncharacterized protein YcfJ